MQCPNCGKSLTEHEFFTSPNGECPSCGVSLNVPTPEQDTEDGIISGDLVTSDDIL